VNNITTPEERIKIKYVYIGRALNKEKIYHEYVEYEKFLEYENDTLPPQIDGFWLSPKNRLDKLYSIGLIFTLERPVNRQTSFFSNTVDVIDEVKNDKWLSIWKARDKSAFVEYTAQSAVRKRLNNTGYDKAINELQIIARQIPSSQRGAFIGDVISKLRF